MTVTITLTKCALVFQCLVKKLRRIGAQRNLWENRVGILLSWGRRCEGVYMPYSVEYLYSIQYTSQMYELIPPYYGRFAAEASALLVEHPGVVSHDISSFISMNLQVPIALMDPEFIDDSDLIFDQVVSIQPKEMSPDWNIR